MWPIIWTAMRTYAPYVTFPAALVVGFVGYNLEWMARGGDLGQPYEERGVLERREERRLQEQLHDVATSGLGHFNSLHDVREFAPRAVLERNRAGGGSVS